MTTQAERLQLGADMANWVYKPGNPRPAGWEIEKVVDGKGTGLDAVILKNTTTGNYFFAVAGTNEGKDVSAWPSAFSGYQGNKAQIDVALDAMLALNFRAKSEHVNVSASGHSLAGQITDLGTYVFGWDSVKFDAVGPGRVIQSLTDAGNDTLTGDSQNNWLAGDERGVDGTDVAQYSGSYVDHHIIKVSDAKGMNTLAVSLLFTSPLHAANNQNWSKRA